LVNAAGGGDVAIVQALLAKGANVNAKDSYGSTPLTAAAGSGHLEVVALLLRKGAAVDAIGDYRVRGSAPSYFGSAVQKLVLEHGAVDATGTPLYIAAYEGHPEVVTLLLDKGAAIEGKEDAVGHYSMVSSAAESAAYHAPLYGAAERGHVDVVRVLLDRGAAIDGKEGIRPLSIATLEDKPNVARLLLDKGAAIDGKDGDGNTALVLACGPAPYSGGLEIVKLLLEKGAAINTKDKYGDTPLARAVSNNRLEIVKLLLEKGAAVDTKDDRGHTPLFDAIEKPEIVRVLLENGADPNTTVSGETALQNAERQGQTRSAELIQEAIAKRR
jgi:serine/threonine-protein phosphatase 6 regulatory ankyrin repeat subunit B